jgi:hypothetical protein
MMTPFRSPCNRSRELPGSVCATTTSVEFAVAQKIRQTSGSFERIQHIHREETLAEKHDEAVARSDDFGDSLLSLVQLAAN